MSATHDTVSELGFDPEALKQKYLSERDKRLRAQEGRNYVVARTLSERYLADPFSAAPAPRAARDEDVEVLIVGGGMCGMMTAARLRSAGIDSIVILDRAADFGGAWYWNRYPGASCDTEAYIYMPLLDETGYVPTEKYAKGAELFRYFQHLGQHFDLYRNACFQTGARAFRWDEALRRWQVTTDRGDSFRARFVCLSTGPLTEPHLPAIPGLADFRGHAFHTCRWDYAYTGGSPDDQTLARLADKRVAIIGTGATAIQAVPGLAAHSQHLYVFQRTPSMVNVRANRATDPAWAQSLRPGWQEARMVNFEQRLLGDTSVPDLVDDGWTWLGRELTTPVQVDGANDPAWGLQLADFRTMEAARHRVDTIIRDPAVAGGLKPWFNVHCRRPCFHDEYLQAFNRPNVTLVDTDGHGVERFTERGVVAGGKEYEVDCIVFSTGFESVQFTHRTGGFSVEGAGGLTLEQKWHDGLKTLHGVLVNGFPNMFVLGHVKDTGGSFNATFPNERQATHAARVITRCRDEGVTRLEITEAAEQRWRKAMQDKAPPLDGFLSECTPSYINNEGKGGSDSLRASLYGGGTLEYAALLDAWLADGFERETTRAHG